MRAATLFLAAIVTVVGLWGASHADDVGLSAPAVATSTVAAPSVDAAGGHLTDTAGEAAASESMLIGIVTCLLGILCGFALAILIVFAFRCREQWFQRQRPRIAPIVAAAAFDHRGRHRLGLHELSLLRI